MKLGNMQPAIDILNPLLEEKCPVLLSLDILKVINELQPELDKINTIRQNLIKQYSITDEDGNVKSKINPDNTQVYDFGENEEKVNNEVVKLMETEVEIKSKINTNNFESDMKIEPIKLKILYDLGLLIN